MTPDLTITVVLPTVGRPTLARALRSLAAQRWRPGDEVLVVGDGPTPAARRAYADVLAGRVASRYVELPTRSGAYGHPIRNWVLETRQARGAWLAALDDDDVYTPTAVADIRLGLAADPTRPHLFRMDETARTGRVLWERPDLVGGNVGNPMFVFPNDPARAGRWGPTYAGDYEMIRDTCAYYPGGPAWDGAVVCVVRPPEPHLPGGGFGTELHNLLVGLGFILPHADDPLRVAELDARGVAGVHADAPGVEARVRAVVAAAGWEAAVRAVVAALRAGVDLDPTNPARSLVAEAVRRAGGGG